MLVGVFKLDRIHIRLFRIRELQNDKIGEVKDFDPNVVREFMPAPQVRCHPLLCPVPQSARVTREGRRRCRFGRAAQEGMCGRVRHVVSFRSPAHYEGPTNRLRTPVASLRPFVPMPSGTHLTLWWRGLCAAGASVIWGRRAALLNPLLVSVSDHVTKLLNGLVRLALLFCQCLEPSTYMSSFLCVLLAYPLQLREDGVLLRHARYGACEPIVSQGGREKGVGGGGGVRPQALKQSPCN